MHATMHVFRKMRARRRIGGLKAEKEKVAATAEIKTELAHHKRKVTSPPVSKEETIFRRRTREWAPLPRFIEERRTSISVGVRPEPNSVEMHL